VNSIAIIASMMFVIVIAEEYEMKTFSFNILIMLSPRCLSYRLQNGEPYMLLPSVSSTIISLF
jgi:hypothetical protein